MSPKRIAGIGAARAASPVRRCGGGGRRGLASAGAAAAAEDERDDRAGRPRGPGAGAPRSLGRAPHRGLLARRPLVRPGVLPRPGAPLADGLLPPRRLRQGRGDGGRGGAPGRPADADARHPPGRRARGRTSSTRSSAAASRSSAGASTRRPRRQGASLRDAAPAPRVRALAARRHAQPRQAARLRPLDQLGEGAAALRHDPRPRARSWRRGSTPATRPTTRSSPRSLVGRRAGARRADRRRAPLDRPRGRGERLQQLGRQRRAAAPPGRR